MVEGPGCKLNGEKLKKRAKGRLVYGIAGTVVEESKAKRSSGVSAFESLVGMRITDVKTLGKELFVFFEQDSCIRVHFQMAGSVRLSEGVEGCRAAKTDAEVLRLDLSMLCVQFFGSSVEIRCSSECQQKCHELADLDICSPTFDSVRAVDTIMEHSNRLICDVILDQLVLPGVGNIIKNEALFNAGINPNSKVKDLSRELITLLVKMNRDFTSVFYKCRKEGTNLSKLMKVYKKQQCVECEGSVVQCKVGEYERLTFYCPSCQTNTKKLPTRNSLLGWVLFKSDWACEVCTLENKPASARCSVCLAPRPPCHVPTTPATALPADQHNKREPGGADGLSRISKRVCAPGPGQNNHPHDPQSASSDEKGQLPSPTFTSQSKPLGDLSAVLCWGHRAAAKKHRVVKESQNKGRLFYTCSKPPGQQCKFFMWGDDHHPLCQHGKVSIIRTVLKQNANNGRNFYCCPLDKHKQCGFFQWADGE